MRSLCSRAASTSSSISSLSQYIQMRIGKCWQDPQHLLHRRSTRADKTQVQTTKSRKYNGPPPPAHVYQDLPFVFEVNFAAQVKNRMSRGGALPEACRLGPCLRHEGQRAFEGAAQKRTLTSAGRLGSPPSCDVRCALPSLSFRNGRLPDATIRWCQGVLADWLIGCGCRTSLGQGEEVPLLPLPLHAILTVITPCQSACIPTGASLFR
jgi:hypothetical protein